MNELDFTRLLWYQIWFDPTHNQAGWGEPRTSGYGGELRDTPPQAYTGAPAITGGDTYPSFPYRGYFNYRGRQVYVDPVVESLLAYTHGYQGLMPVTQQPLAGNPYPWDENLQRSGKVY